MPRQAKTRAAASGMAASNAATAGRWRAVSAIRYWAVKLTAAAAAARTHRPTAALRSHKPDRSVTDLGLGGVPMSRLCAFRVRGRTGARATAPPVARTGRAGIAAERAIRGGGEFGVMQRGCAGGSGRGYYALGLRVDVLGRPG